MQRFGIIAIVLLCSSSSFGQSVSIDHTFGDNGLIQFQTPSDALGVSFFDVAVHPNDHLAAAGTFADSGSSNDFLAMFDENGNAVVSFGNQGTFVHRDSNYNDVSRAIALLNDGRMVLAGDRITASTSQSKMVCVTAQGQIDPTFGTNGVFSTSIGLGTHWTNDVAVLPDGRIVSLGSVDTYSYIICVTPNGTLDQSFGDHGVLLFDIAGTPAFGWKMAIDDQGRILVAMKTGTFLNPTAMACSRILPNGTLDASFADDGHFFVDRIPDDQYTGQQHGEAMVDLAIAVDGSIYCVGNYGTFSPSERTTEVWKLNDSGELKQTFGNAGSITHTFGSTALAVPKSITISPSDDISVVGKYSGNATEQLYVMRFDKNGTTLNVSSSSLISPISVPAPTEVYNLSSGIATQADGRIVVSCSFIFGVQGLLAFKPMISTSVSTTVQRSEFSIYPNPASSFFSINGEMSADGHVELYDPVGKLVKRFSARSQYFLPAGLSSGRYFVHIVKGDHSEVRSLVIH